MSTQQLSSNLPGPSWRRARRAVAALATVVVLGLGLAGGCAKYNTYYNAEKAYNEAEHDREERLKLGEDVSRATGAQKQKYQEAIKKAQKILDEYPGHGLTDDALYIQGKSYQRIASYRMSIRKLDLLFTNFPQTPYLEESIFLQAVNYLLLGDASRSQDLLDRLERQFPDSRFQSEALRSSGDNAYALEDWEDAVESYERFLERFPNAENWDDSSLRLGESLFELHRYAEANEVLDRIAKESTVAERVFRAQLLQARSRARMGDTEGAEELITALKAEATLYTKEGEVVLVEAENLLVRGDRGGTIALLEGMPEEHITREVKPVRAELLGNAYLASEKLDNDDLEQLRINYQEAMTGRQYLEEPEMTAQVLQNVKDYLAAEGRIPDADPERAAELRLLQANAMLFGFERPRRALDLYVTVAADSAADSLVAPRALYGAMLVYEVTLENPDSAAVYRSQLEDRYPESPQAYEVSAGADADLLAYLLAREEAAMRLAYESGELGDVADFVPSDEVEAEMSSGLRRRQIYLQRRPLLVFPPPQAAIAANEARRQQALLIAEADVDSVIALQDAERETLSFDAGMVTAGDSLATGPPDSMSTIAPVPAPIPAPVDTVPAPVEEEEEPEEEKPRSWDF